jgi:RNA-directed DNA polymerase
MSRRSKGMKRVGNLYQQICSIENLRLADAKARKGKAHQYGVQAHDKNREANILALHEALSNRSYRTSTYRNFTIREPKERLISCLPYFPDRIVHHAIMNLLEPIFMRMFTADTYSCIKGRGIHGAAYAVKRALRNQSGTTYCLKLDVKKFYPSIDHDILKALLRRKLKDQDLLRLLDEIIDSAQGVPIGNYLSQYFANFYLTGFDHWLKEAKGVKNYFRYADDLVILSGSKEYLHGLLKDITDYLSTNLKLQVKSNWQVFPVAARGIDYVGYVFYHTHIRLRKSIKQNFARMMARRPNLQSIISYQGWTCHCDGSHLFKTLTNEKIQRPKHHGDNAGIHWRQN